MEQRVYLIPGVATDRRVFAELHLPGYEKVYLDWMRPKANERIAAYAARMVARLDGDTSPVLVSVGLAAVRPLVKEELPTSEEENCEC